MKLTSLCLLSLCLCACFTAATGSFTPAKPHYQPQVIASPDEIEVYRSEKPQHAYVEIGIVRYPDSSLEYALPKLKALVSQQGGNAIIDLEVRYGGITGTAVKMEKEKGVR